ncbi:hypothetical protein, partial [Xanthomonas fragariae]|uniref:hypothetical protein n=1 Tax=Xanthomonas fragariae TaxID=48664 RepID=UPI001F2B49E2
HQRLDSAANVSTSVACNEQHRIFILDLLSTRDANIHFAVAGQHALRRPAQCGKPRYFVVGRSQPSITV